MGLITATDEYTSSVPPARVFKALIVDSDNLLPKLLPQSFKSFEIVHGDGGAGSIKQMNFAEGSVVKSKKHRIDELNAETYTYNYTLIEGDALTGKLEKISYEVKLGPSLENGTIAKMTTKYYTLFDAAITEEEIKAEKDKAIGLFKAVEAFLLQNPDAYA